MDPSAPVTVAKGTVITCICSALFTGLRASFKGQSQNPGLLAASAALNGGIAAVTFFSIREYAVSPILVLTMPSAQYSHRRRELRKDSSKGNGETTSAASRLSWLDLRTYKLLDSGASGAIAGGVLNTWKRGRPGLISGLTTGALFCTLIQYAVNEADIARVKYLAQRLRESQSQERNPVPVFGAQAPPALPSKLSWDRVLETFGFYKLTDEEHSQKKKSSREAALKKVRQLEQKIEEPGQGDI